MLKKHYKIRFSSFICPFILWLLWVAGWALAPGEELIWPPIKWIFIAVFAPIGIALLGALSGYRIEIADNKVRFGFFPFIRTKYFTDIKDVRKGGTYTLSLWETEEFLTFVFHKGEEVTLPCDNARELISIIRPHLHRM